MIAIEDLIIYTASTALWTKLLAIGTFVIAAGAIVTSIIVWETLLGNRTRQREENSIRLLRIWREQKYNEILIKLIKDYNNLFPKGKIVELNSKKELEILLKLESLKDFIFRIHYYLFHKKITMENLKTDFSEIFYINDKLAVLGLYNFLNKYENRYKYIKDKNINLIKAIGEYERRSVSGTERGVLEISIIDIFFMKIAKYQNNDELIKKIQNNIKKTVKYFRETLSINN